MNPDVPEAKYRLGQKVFLSATNWGPESAPCPKCKGQSRIVVEAFEQEHVVHCPACRGAGTIQVYNYRTTTKPDTRTIGSIRIDTSEKHENKVSYMCRETGIGSGNIYRESDLHSTEFEAQTVSAAKTAAAQAQRDKTHEQDEYGVWREKRR